MIIIFILNSILRHFPKDMPLASTCSAAISAACHRPAEDFDAHLLPVQWGVVSDGNRCAFTTHRDVKPLREGNFYIGIPPGVSEESVDNKWRLRWQRIASTWPWRSEGRKWHLNNARTKVCDD